MTFRALSVKRSNIFLSSFAEDVPVVSALLALPVPGKMGPEGHFKPYGESVRKAFNTF
jgi:hypothetical protein